MFVHVCSCVSRSEVSLRRCYSSSVIIWTHGLSVIHNSPQSSLAGQQALGISRLLAPQLQDYKGLPPRVDYFTWVLRSQLRSLNLRGKPLPDKAVSLVPKYFKLRSETIVRNAKGK